MQCVKKKQFLVNVLKKKYYFDRFLTYCIQRACAEYK